MSGHRIHDWTTDRDKICAAIRETRKPLKIVLKTKNDPQFLPGWVAHHEQIAGADGLVIFDNGSNDKAVLEFYEGLPQETLIVRFAGFHNDLHRVHKYPDLYNCLQASSRHFSFLDTDELMIWVTQDGSRWLAGASLIEELLRIPDNHSVPGVWADNLAGSSDVFRLFMPSGPRLPAGLRTGKPIMSSLAQVDGLVLHNFQYGRRYFSAPSQKANLLILHLKNLVPSQRVRVNIEKLRQYRVLAPDEGINEALDIDPNAIKSANPRQWLKEIRQMHNAFHKEPLQTDTVLNGPGRIQMHKSGSLCYATEEDRLAFAAFLVDPNPALDQALADRTPGI